MFLCRHLTIVTDLTHATIGKLVQSHHVATTTTVKGKVTTTYTHHEIPAAAGMPNTDDIKVPGKKIIVMAAIVFIDELSAFVSRAITVVVALSCWVTRLKTYNFRQILRDL